MGEVRIAGMLGEFGLYHDGTNSCLVRRRVSRPRKHALLPALRYDSLPGPGPPPWPPQPAPRAAAVLLHVLQPFRAEPLHRC